MVSTTQRVHHPALKPIAQELRQLANLFEAFSYEEEHFSSADFHVRLSEKTSELSNLIRKGTEPVSYAGEVVRRPDGLLYIEDTHFRLQSGQHLSYWSSHEQRHIPSKLAYYGRLFLLDRPHLEVEGLHVIIRCHHK